MSEPGTSDSPPPNNTPDALPKSEDQATTPQDSDPDVEAIYQVPTFKSNSRQKSIPNPLPKSEDPAPPPSPQSEDPANQTPTVQSVPDNQFVYQVPTYQGGPPENNSPNPLPQSENPAPAPPPPPVQTVMVQSDPDIQADYQVPKYKGSPPQNNSPNPLPQSEYPAPAPQVNLPPPVKTVMVQSDPAVQVAYQVHAYKGYPIQNHLQNSMPQQGQYIADYPMESIGTPKAAPPPAGLQPNNQPPPVDSYANQSDATDSAAHQVQSAHQVKSHAEGPPPLPPPLQKVVNQSGPSNSALDQAQAGPALVHSPAGLQTWQQPLPVQTVIHPSDPMNPAQAQSFAASLAPPLIVSYGVPPGLEYLIQVDQILVRQKTECIDLSSGIKTNNQYEIKKSIGQEIYHASENSDCFTRHVLGPERNFEMRIKDNMGQEVMRMHKPIRFYLQEIEIQAPPGFTIGYVKQEWPWFIPRFSVRGPCDETLLMIHGPIFPYRCCSDVNFEVKGLVNLSVGQIIKQQSGFIKAHFTDASNFCIQFPPDLDVKMKAVLLGACFLFDVLFFDKSGNIIFKLIRKCVGD